MHAMVLANRPLLIHDIKEYFEEYRPDISPCYPQSYFNWIIDDSINIATQFNIDDAYSMRLFVRLRWDISPGFYKQPQIANVLKQTNRTAENRFNELATADFSEAWNQAEQLNDPNEWRVRFWEKEND